MKQVITREALSSDKACNDESTCDSVAIRITLRTKPAIAALHSLQVST